MSIDLREVEVEHQRWVLRNFGDHQSIDPMLGLVEEVGELAHAMLKRKQGIRDVTQADLVDACGDIAIYLMDICHCEGFTLGEAIGSAWSEVSERDWIRFPGNGRTE